MALMPMNFKSSCQASFLDPPTAMTSGPGLKLKFDNTMITKQLKHLNASVLFRICYMYATDLSSEQFKKEAVPKPSLSVSSAPQ